MKGTYSDLVQSFTNATGAELIIKSMISSKSVKFPAFLTNISQDFKSTWTSENVYGRMDPIVSFQNTTRTVQVGFNVPAASVNEAKQNQAKFSTLSQMLYPAYFDSTGMTAIPADSSQGVDAITVQEGEGSKTMAKSPLVRVKFGNLIRAQDGSEGLLGWIDGVSFKPTLTLGMFTEGGGNFYAKNFELSFTLNVLHEDDVGVDSATGEWLGGNDRFPF
jgi:hypothetical protein